MLESLPFKSGGFLSWKAVLCLVVAALAVAALLRFAGSGVREDFKRSACAGNLKHIGAALKSYAADNDGFLPLGDETAVFSMLRERGYMPYSQFFVCPSRKRQAPAAPDAPLTERNVSYVYCGGGLNVKVIPSNTPVAYDMPGNHKDFGNVLFIDGRTEGLEGGDWFARASSGPLAGGKR